jgi:hypothetical protein
VDYSVVEPRWAKSEFAGAQVPPPPFVISYSLYRNIIDDYSLKFVGQIYEESSVSVMEPWEPWAKAQLNPSL